MKGYDLMRFLNDKKGISYISSCIFFLLAISLFSVVFNLLSAVTSLITVKEDAERILNCAAVENAVLYFNSIKQDHNKTDGFRGVSFRDRFAMMTGAETDTDGNLRLDGPEKILVWSMTDPEIRFGEDGHLNLEARLSLKVPFRLLEFAVIEIPVEMTVTSKYVRIPDS